MKWSLCAGIVALAIFAAAYMRSAVSPQALNVIIISIDSVRQDHMGIYGYKRNTTPRLDAFAKNSAIFDNYFASSFLTPESEISVQTGMYPISSGLLNFDDVIKPSVMTLAQVLHENGWQTAAFGSSPEYVVGSWNLAKSFARGFDEYSSNGATSSPWYGRSQPPFAQALAWIKNARQNGRPFYLWFHVGSAHWPYGHDEAQHFSDASYTGALKEPLPSARAERFLYFTDLYGKYFEKKLYAAPRKMAKADATADLAYVRDRYDDGLVMTDREIGTFLDSLDGMGLSSNTIYVIESEHGEDFGEHGYIAHYDITDTQTHEPLFIRVPGLQARRIPALVSGVDIMPTLLDLLHVSHSGTDGVSAEPVLHGRATSTRAEVYLTRTPLWERLISINEPWLRDFAQRDSSEHFYDTAIRTEKWKLIHRRSAKILGQYSWYGHLTGKEFTVHPYELYDVVSDPLESNDVFAKYADIAKDLQKRLSVWEKGMSGSISPVPSQGSIQPYF